MAATKKSVQSLDGVKADSAPSSTSRPVIVTNRPMMASDPMLSSTPESSDAEKPSNEPVKTAPLAAGEKVINREAKNIAPVSAEAASAEETSSVTDKTNESAESAQTDVAKIPGEADRERKDVPGETSAENAAEPSKNAEPAQTEDENTSTEAPAASDRDLELEQLIAKGTYAVPIGQVKRRRRKVLLTMLFILLLVAVLLDVMLDMGMLALPGVPHTNFF